METWPTDLHLLGKTRLALRDEDTKKTELRITFGIIADRLRADTTVDLSAFAKTGLELDKLVIHVLGLTGRPSTNKSSQHPSYTQKRKYAQYAERLRPWLQKDVERLGEVLVGSGCSVMFWRKRLRSMWMMRMRGSCLR
jgi:hypothetical protein